MSGSCSEKPNADVGPVGEKLAAALSQIGLPRGADLLVHSSMKSFRVHVPGGTEEVYAGLRKAIGDKGTLMFPTMTWNTVNKDQPVFDVLHSPCSTGLLPETFRKRPGVRRSLHPTHSAAAEGPRTDFYLNDHLKDDTCTGPNSPYIRLLNASNGYILFIGVGIEYNTCFHALEEECDMPLLFAPGHIRMVIIDEDGHRIFSPQRRFFTWHARCHDEMEPILDEAGGILTFGQAEKSRLMLVRANAMAEFIRDKQKDNPCYLCKDHRRPQEGSG